jgi:polar amino acid transport system substrate-binding protein
MKKINRHAFVFAILTICSFTSAVRAEPLIITTEEYPPFNMTKGTEVTGLSTDILKKALESAKIDYSLAVYPWQRAYDMALKQANTCVYSTTLTEQREPLFKWVGPLAKNDWVLFAKADNTIKVASIDDLKPYTIGGYQGDALSIFLKEKGLKVDEVISDKLNPRKLQAGRIDFWASGRLMGPYLASQEGVSGLKPVLVIKETTMYLACGKSVPDETITKLNGALKQMSEDGTAAALTQAYQ